MTLGKNLNSLAEDIADFWFSNSNKKDFRFYELFGKVDELAIKTTKEIEINTIDIELSNIMTFIEKRFYIPILKINLINWLKADSKNTFVLNIYQQLSQFRNL